jgi:hypothetical protein
LNLKDNFKVHDDFKQEKLVKGQYIQEKQEKLLEADKELNFKNMDLLSSVSWIYCPLTGFSCLKSS